MSLRKILAAATAVSALACAGAANAAGVLIYDDFESYVSSPSNGPAFGTSELNFTAFDNFTVEDGTVDYINTPNSWGLSTPHGAGFVDLDGSTGNGGVLRTDTFGFGAGAVITLSFYASGNQRGGVDDWSFGFETAGGPINFLNVSVENDPFFDPAVGPQALGNFAGPALASGVGALAAGDPWRRYSISFTAGNAGSLSAFIGTSSADNIGVLVDNVTFSITPEPATWAMMLMGFGGMGALLRRRRAAFA